MRHSLLKLTGLLLALMLALTGCNLIGVDQLKQLDVDFAKLEKDYSAVVADYDGGSITKADVLGSYASMYSYYSQLYSMFGMNITSDVGESIKQQVVESAVQDVAIAKEFDARGLTLSDEKMAEIQSAADTNYKQAYDSFYASAEGKGDVKARQTEYNLYQNGYSKDVFYNNQLAQAKRDLLEETIKAEVSELTDEQLQTAYDEAVAADKESYEGSPSSFESAMSSEDTLVTWIPEGYRVVKHILVKPEDDVLNAVTDARTALSTAQTALADFESELVEANATAETPAEEAAEETAEATGDAAEATEDTEDAEATRTAAEIQADIDTAKAEVDTAKAAVEKAESDCLAAVKAKTDEIYAKLAEGADFADLIAEYGEDPGMKNEPTATRGYYVCADQGNWDANFNTGAMALANLGDVSQTPVISTSGVHIIRYESDATAGAVPLEDVREALYKKTLDSAKDTHYSDALTSLTAALNPVYHLDAFTIS